MTFAATAIFGSSLLSGLTSNAASRRQTDAANRATDLQSNIWETTQQNAAPYIGAGRTALNQIGDLNGYFTHQFDRNDLNAGLAPNYEFMLEQGLRGVGNAANTSGSRLGGNALAGLTRYATDYAGNAYQQAFNNYNTQRNDIFNRLSSIAGLGENAAVGTGNTGVQAGSNISNTMLGGANAAAAGLVGVGNAVNNGIGNYLGWSYLNRPSNTSGGSYLGGSGWSPGENGPTYYGAGP